MERSDFHCDPLKNSKKKRRNPAGGAYLILGFDTEYKTPDLPVTRDEIVAGEAKYRVLSYQFSAKTSDGKEWDGICCPEGDQRMTLGDFLVFALGVGAREHGIRDIPTVIYMAGHFTRADVPAFLDFQDMTSFLSSVRSTFISVDAHHEFKLPFENDGITLQVFFRDTMLLSPATSKGLKALGDLVGIPKLQLDPDVAMHRKMITQMDTVRENSWELFRAYAINDARICVRYIELIIQMYEQVTGKKKVPLTLTSIGVDLLLKCWRDELEIAHAEILGKESVVQKVYDKKRGYCIKLKQDVPLEEVHRHVAFVSESYHGGRNEQFWFGPGFENEWSDWDLSSAYPTAMSLIGMPEWREIRVTTNLDDFDATTLGFAEVEFEFPPGTRYPTLPVRTDNGLVFPLSGKSHCASPEIVVARNLGAKLNIKYGIVVPADPNVRIFGAFIKECLEQRKNAGSKTLSGLLWKEIGNSTYGKTAQGLMKKRVYDLRERMTQPLPPSRITNAFFASFITSFVRALLGEIINSLGASPYVFSCTTDGFLSNASAEEIAAAQQGTLARLFAESRKQLTGDPKVLEVKHSIRQPLGWRTRGQATLLAGMDRTNGEDFNYVLAKGGIHTKAELESVPERNNEIVKLFFARTPNTVMQIIAMTGMRDIVEHDADLVEKIIAKRLSMEFDWKRRPMGLGFSNRYNHVVFSTQPWHSVDQFRAIRESWEEYTHTDRVCIRTPQDFDAFATYVDSHAGMPKEHARFLRRREPDIKRLRALLCSAWRQSKAGLTWKAHGMSARQFADFLSGIGIPCKKTDVENGKNREFVANSCPPTELVRKKLKAVKLVFTSLQIAEFLHVDSSRTAISIRPTSDCPYVARTVHNEVKIRLPEPEPPLVDQCIPKQSIPSAGEAVRCHI